MPPRRAAARSPQPHPPPAAAPAASPRRLRHARAASAAAAAAASPPARDGPAAAASAASAAASASAPPPPPPLLIARASAVAALPLLARPSAVLVPPAAIAPPPLLHGASLPACLPLRPPALLIVPDDDDDPPARYSAPPAPGLASPRSPTPLSSASAALLLPPPAHPPLAPIRQIPARGRRGCTDCVAILLFVLATAAIALVHNVALIQGDFRRLVYPRDSEGNLCGVSVGQDSLRDLQPARYLAYYNLSLPNGLRRCVSSCPATSQSLAALVCTYGSDPRDSDPPASRAALVSSGNCTTAYASSQVLYRCVPNALTQGSANTSLAGWSAALASDLGTETYLGVLFQQLQSFWWTVAISLTASILLSFAWILLLVAVGKAIVWITVVLLILLSVGVSGFLVAAYIYLQYFDASPLSCILAAFGGGSAYTNMALLIVSIVCCVATAAVIVAVVLLRRAIRLSASIIVETSKDFRQQHALGGIAFARFCVVALVGLYSVAVIMLLSTIGTVRQTSSLTYAVNGRTVSVDRGLVFVPSQLAVFLEVTVALWFLWFFGAADAIASIAISGAITECYFTRDKTNIMHSFAARNAISRTLLHHMGSAILGCVAIPAMAVTNAVVFSIATSFLKVRKVGDAERKDLFFDRWGAWYQKMQFAVNDKAYIMIAMHGHDFCHGAEQGRALALRNAVKLKVVSGVAASVLFFGRLVITILAAIGGLALVIISTGSSTPLTSLAPIALVIVIFAFIGASVFVTPLGVAIETIFLCFCEDVEMNDGSLERPYYMSDSLKKFMGHHRRQSALPDKPPGLEA